MVMLVAPVAAQLSVLLALELMLAGLATKEVISGAEPFPGGEVKEPPETQPTRPAERNRVRAKTPRFSAEEGSSRERSVLLEGESMRA
jgi:hypothetical protein